MTPLQLEKLQNKQMTEAQFQSNILIEAALAGWRVYYIPDVVYRKIGLLIRQGRLHLAAPGFPDLVLTKEGEPPIYFELKSESGELKDGQREWRDLLLSTGTEWHCFRPRHYKDLVLPRLQGEPLSPAAGGLEGELWPERFRSSISPHRTARKPS